MAKDRKHPVGVTLRGGELAAWCAATGRDKPGEPVVVTCNVQVGNCTLKLETKRDEPITFPLKELTRKTYKPRNHWHTTCGKVVKGAAASNAPWV